MNKYLGITLSESKLADIEDLSTILDQIQKLNTALPELSTPTMADKVNKKIKNLEKEFKSQTIKLYNQLYGHFEGVKLSAKDKKPLDIAVEEIIENVLELAT